MPRLNNMAILKTESIVLKTFDFRETSIIASFFTKEHGKIKGILKGIRKDRKKFGSTLEPFSCNEIIYYQSRNSEIHLVSQCDCNENFNKIRANIEATAVASYLVDLVDHLTAQEEINLNIYSLLFESLRHIDTGAQPQRVSRIFMLKFLKLIGFKPRLNSCIACNSNIIEQGYFNVKRGGLLCPKCWTDDEYSTGILKGTIVSLLHMEQSPWQTALRLTIDGEVKEELNRIVDNFVEYHLQVKPKSKAILEILS